MQSNEVKGSYHMEKEGLARAIQFLKKKKFNIGVLVTDRHRQISKWLRENFPAIDHRYDIWHVAKCMLYCACVGVVIMCF
jgi:solute carrier family 8 (sodium/calcium exchanger)